jgi:hypothetical protein
MIKDSEVNGSKHSSSLNLFMNDFDVTVAPKYFQRIY